MLGLFVDESIFLFIWLENELFEGKFESERSFQALLSLSCEFKKPSERTVPFFYDIEWHSSFAGMVHVYVYIYICM